jgi:GDPmannose 4,6-dehydratase
MKTAIVIGASGMDGSLMCELLLSKGYMVHGSYASNKRWVENLFHPNFTLHKFDLSNENAIWKFVLNLKPDEVYNFGGVTFSPDSERLPMYTKAVNHSAVFKIMEVCFHNHIKFFQASSSEVFGNIKDQELNEDSPRNPHTPYAEAKNEVDLMMRQMRNEEGALFYNAISFNHECERRGLHFLPAKICNYVKQVRNNSNNYFIKLGALTSRRDWGYAPDFVQGFYDQVQGLPSELIFATGVTHSVEDLLEKAFAPHGYDWKKYVLTDSQLVRLGERNNIWGDYSKAKETIGWQPTTKFDDFIYKMTL